MGRVNQTKVKQTRHVKNVIQLKERNHHVLRNLIPDSDVDNPAVKQKQ